MSKLRHTWFGLRQIGGQKSDLSITYLGKCIDGWKDYYEDLKPWQLMKYSNPILAKSKNWGYSEQLGCYRIIFCLLWHQIQWSYKKRG